MQNAALQVIIVGFHIMLVISIVLYIQARLEAKKNEGPALDISGCWDAVAGMRNFRLFIHRTDKKQYSGVLQSNEDVWPVDFTCKGWKISFKTQFEGRLFEFEGMVEPDGKRISGLYSQYGVKAYWAATRSSVSALPLSEQQLAVQLVHNAIEQFLQSMVSIADCHLANNLPEVSTDDGESSQQKMGPNLPLEQSMKSLKDVIPDPKKVVDLEPEALGKHVLHVLHSSNGKDIKRSQIAKDMASHYHQDFHHEVAHAVEEALGWLAQQCLMGASPYDQDLIFLTRRGKKAAADYQEEHPVDIE
jgi:hypothetical protein